MPTSSNADQVAYWNSPTGERWAALQGDIDAVFAPLTRTALDRAGAAPGERVVDVGCGCGTTSLELARRVLPGGAVLGVDVSEPMLAVALRRARAAALTGLAFARSDAATHAFEPGRCDLAFSRFGVMFFADPAAAFANIRGGLKPGGRLLFACWRPLADNAWFSVPLQAALPHAPPQPPSDPHAPGPFAFADPDRVRVLLAEAGFTAIEVEPHDAPMRLAGPGDLEAATAFATKIGPTSRLLADLDDTARAAALADVGTALAAHDGPDGVLLGGAVWIVSARAT